MSESRELDVPAAYGYGTYYALCDAIDAASDQDQVTWLIRDGKRIAAIVPVDVAERELRTVDEQYEQARRLTWQPPPGRE